VTRRRSIGHPVALAAVVALGAAIGASEWVRIVHDGALAADFHNPLWQAAKDIVDGVSPYFPPSSPLIGNADPDLYPALYPPPLMLAVVPLSVLPLWVAYGVWVALMIAALLSSLWLTGVRDWRVYVLWAVSAAPAATLPQGNATPLLLVAVALMWRYRDRAWLAGTALAAAIAIKLWPSVLALWLVRTRRVRAAVVSLAVASAAILAGWSVMGFDGFVDYPELLRAHSRALAIEGELIVGLARYGGNSLTTASAFGLVAGAALAAIGWRAADERVSLAFFIGAALFASPLGWPQYLMLFVVPIAALSPTLSALWLFVLAPYGSMLLMHQEDGGRLSRGLWTTATTLLLLAVIWTIGRRRAAANVPAPATASP
jgi:Glycosyltransferase family 87